MPVKIKQLAQCWTACPAYYTTWAFTESQVSSMGTLFILHVFDWWCLIQTLRPIYLTCWRKCDGDIWWARCSVNHSIPACQVQCTTPDNWMWMLCCLYMDLIKTSNNCQIDSYPKKINRRIYPSHVKGRYGLSDMKVYATHQVNLV